MRKECLFNDDTIVAFKSGKGGRFNAGGYLTCLGEKSIGDFTDELFLDEETGTYFDESGHDVGLSEQDVESGIGSIEIDGIYNTIYTEKLGDIEPNSDECDAMVNRSDSFTREQAILYFTEDMDDAYKEQLLTEWGVDEDEWSDYLDSYND